MNLRQVTYLLEKNEDEKLVVVHTTLIGKKFKKRGADFFKECPVISDKIANKIYKIKDLPMVIQKFKEKCK